jgi:preprotein translocase subunit SecA
MKRDVDYVVKDGEILIVDEFTGRLMFGRRYSNGLHQAIEAKEGLEVRKESQTLATITLQNYFRMYAKLAGMTGTAKTEEDEFRHIYNMDVVVVPTNRPIARKDLPDSIYKSMEGKYRAVLKDIVERHQTGQPILVGTIAIETSEFISQILKRQGIKHEVLNAKQHEREAEIVAQAGRLGAVTIATNMAGRGTDIVLGGNPDFMAKNELTKKGYTEEQIYTVVSPLESDDPEILEGRKLYDKHFAEFKAVTDEEAAKVKEAGGLHIIGTERHESRRIDNQLRGRSGRQGDPGSSQFYISFDDDLMRLFSSDRVKDMVEKLGMEDDMPLEANILTKSIEGAQKKVEGRNFGIRKHVLQYDDVMNRQREIIYSERGKVLHGDNIKEDVENMLEKLIEESIANHTSNSEYGEEWDLEGLTDHLHQIYLPKDAYHCDNVESLTREQLKSDLLKIGRDIYAQKEEEFTPERFREVERYVLLKVVDSKWIDHIDAMDQLKQGIGLRAVGQEDPVRAYQNEGFDMFGEMIDSIQEDTVRYLFGATLQTNTERRQQAVITGSSSASSEAAPKKPETRKEPKVGRNDPCPCGSGKKYKKCHGANE